MVFWRQGLALLAGGASVLAYAPFELFPLAFLSLAVLYGLLDPMAPAGLSGMPRRRRARHTLFPYTTLFRSNRKSVV